MALVIHDCENMPHHYQAHGQALQNGRLSCVIWLSAVCREKAPAYNTVFISVRNFNSGLETGKVAWLSVSGTTTLLRNCSVKQSGSTQQTVVMYNLRGEYVGLEVV
jgi:hypothetical protein